MRLFIVILILSCFSVKAQETVWLDSNLTPTSEEKAKFYRIKNDSNYGINHVIDYYKNGEKKREGNTVKLTKNKILFDGLVTEYYTNGKTAKKTFYKKGVLHGICKTFFETGELKIQIRYKDGKENGIWKEFHKSGKIKTKGKFKDGEKIGVWKTFYKNEYSDLLDY